MPELEGSVPSGWKDAIYDGVWQVYSYDVADWRLFETDGLILAGPESVVQSPVKAGH